MYDKWLFSSRVIDKRRSIAPAVGIKVPGVHVKGYLVRLYLCAQEIAALMHDLRQAEIG